MSSTSHDPFEGFDPTDLEGSFAAIEKAITSSEPIVRDFNRHFTDLLGACPSSIDGKWLNLSQSGEVTFHLTLVDAFRLTTALQETARLVDFAEVRTKVPSHKKALEYVPTLFSFLKTESAAFLARRRPKGA